MTSHKKRNEYKKMSLMNIILFSVIIGRALTKEVGPLIDNNLLNDESHRQSTDAKDKEEKAIT